jgi:hypothetical protein
VQAAALRIGVRTYNFGLVERLANTAAIVDGEATVNHDLDRKVGAG